jgi:hypothetical protein
MPDEDVEVARGFRPYITRMKEKFGPAAETLGVSFDEVFVDTRPIALELSSDSLDDTGMLLVRGMGDTKEHPEYFRETDGDKRVKKVLEDCIGVKIGQFIYVTYGQ